MTIPECDCGAVLVQLDRVRTVTRVLRGRLELKPSGFQHGRQGPNITYVLSGSETFAEEDDPGPPELSCPYCGALVDIRKFGWSVSPSGYFSYDAHTMADLL